MSATDILVAQQTRRLRSQQYNVFSRKETHQPYSPRASDVHRADNLETASLLQVNKVRRAAQVFLQLMHGFLADAGIAFVEVRDLDVLCIEVS